MSTTPARRTTPLTPRQLLVACLAVLPLLLAPAGAAPDPQQKPSEGDVQRLEAAERLHDSLRLLQLSLNASQNHLQRLHQHAAATKAEVERLLAAAGSAGGALHIPRVIHQSWKNDELPPKFKLWAASWKVHNPDWQYRLWTDEQNLQLVERHFPWFKGTYAALPHNISRADAARYMYMFKHGGLYADLDMECLKPMDGLLAGKRCVLAQMGADRNFVHSLPNAFMASEPGHPFWVMLLADIALAVQGGRDTGAETLTGPLRFKRVMDRYWRRAGLEAGGGMHVLPPGVIYPFDWHTHTEREDQLCHGRLNQNVTAFTGAECKALFPDAYAVTYWEHSWGR